MKKNKLNAVIASILSLGVVCSGSAFASKIGENGSKEEIKGRAVLGERSSNVRNTAKLKGPKKEDELRRYNAARSRIIAAIKSRKKEFAEYKTKISYELRYLIECSEDWKDLKPPFDMRRWHELPLSTEDFVSKSIKCHDELESILSSLMLHSVMNGLKYEAGAFLTLKRLCNRIYNRYYFII